MAIPTRVANPGAPARSNSPIAGCTDLSTAGSTVNSTAAITMPAVAGKQNIIGQVHWSYSAQTNGRLTITDGVATIFDEYLGAGQFLTFDPPKAGSTNSEVVVRLHPVSGQTGRLDVNGWINA